MKTLFYIRNTKTDQNFDTIEMRFYSNNWEPMYEEDKQFLEGLIENDPQKFENCIIEKVEVENQQKAKT